MSYVIIGYSPSGKVTTVGTPGGFPFNSRRSAERYARMLEEYFPGPQFLVLPIEPFYQPALRAHNERKETETRPSG